jgi:hypothetical protein
MALKNVLSHLAIAVAATLLSCVWIAHVAESSQSSHQNVWKPQQRFGKRSTKELVQAGVDSRDLTLSGNR